MKVVEVTWLDATRSDDEPNLNADGAVRRTVGWLVKDRKKGVIIAMSRDEGDGVTPFERWFFIPRPYIIKIRRLK